MQMQLYQDNPNIGANLQMFTGIPPLPDIDEEDEHVNYITHDDLEAYFNTKMSELNQLTKRSRLSSKNSIIKTHDKDVPSPRKYSNKERNIASRVSSRHDSPKPQHEPSVNEEGKQVSTTENMSSKNRASVLSGEEDRRL